MTPKIIVHDRGAAYEPAPAPEQVVDPAPALVAPEAKEPPKEKASKPEG